MTAMEQIGAARLLADKVAVVTGANRGIGQAMVHAFAAHGAQVFACMREIETNTLERLQEIEHVHGVNVRALRLDLADELSIKSAIKEIAAASARVDVLVNNAGVASGSLFQMTPMAEMRRVFEVNFFGQMLLTQGLSRLMARNKSGSIINISSTAAEIADPGTLTYGSSKAAFARATQSMAAELGASGIRVNAIAPGVTRTDMYDQMTAAAREKLIAASAMKRAAEPQDIANVAVFLASELSSFVTGQTLRVDGGMV
jgi:3-oxoacyl-[acyl-carrier protein] reductase